MLCPYCHSDMVWEGEGWECRECGEYIWETCRIWGKNEADKMRSMH